MQGLGKDNALGYKQKDASKELKKKNAVHSVLLQRGSQFLQEQSLSLSAYT